jgi:L-lactate dehydrogenase complex protein LldG
MNVTPSKENILKRIRNALSQPVPLPFPQAEGNQSVFEKEESDLDILFAETFSGLSGRFVFCSGHDELADNLRSLVGNNNWSSVYCRELQLLHTLQPYSLSFLNASQDIGDADAGLTTCEALVARTGSVVLSAGQPSGRTVGVFPPVHIVIAYTDQLVFDVKDALNVLREKYGEELPSMISFQSGPSRTSDIEKRSVIGVHGPREVYVFLVDRQQETI